MFHDRKKSRKFHDITAFPGILFVLLLFYAARTRRLRYLSTLLHLRFSGDNKWSFWPCFRNPRLGKSQKVKLTSDLRQFAFAFPAKCRDPLSASIDVFLLNRFCVLFEQANEVVNEEIDRLESYLWNLPTNKTKATESAVRPGWHPSWRLFGT